MFFSSTRRSGKGPFGVISAHVWDNYLWGKQTKAMIWAALKEQSWESFKSWLQGQGGCGCGFLLGTSVVSLGRGTENIVWSFCFSFSFFSDIQDELLSFIVHSNIYFAALQQQGLDRFHKLNFPWTCPSSDFTLPAARLGFKAVCTEAGNI